MTSRRGNPVARAGNYAQETDSLGMDDSMKGTLYGTKLTKVEKDYLAGTNGRPSARKAIDKARKANKQPPARHKD